jgi:hypothetical protein
VEHVKTSTAPVKISVKRPSDANSASPKSVKLSKKTIPCVITFVAPAHDTLLTSRLKTTPGALDLVVAGGHPRSKTIGGTSGSKTAGGILVSKGVPPTGPMAGASLEESQDSSPRGPTT